MKFRNMEKHNNEEEEKKNEDESKEFVDNIEVHCFVVVELCFVELLFRKGNKNTRNWSNR